jgi:hypothetical protein
MNVGAFWHKSKLEDETGIQRGLKGKFQSLLRGSEPLNCRQNSKNLVRLTQKWKIRVMNIKTLFIILVAVQLGPALHSRAGTYDVAADFSTNANPNGVWSYGYATTLGGSLILYTNNSYSTASVIGWWQDIYLGAPGLFYNTTDHATTAGDGTPNLAPHQACFHPGPNNEYCIYRFTAPAAGNYQLQAAFVGADIVGTSSDVHVLVNDSPIFDGLVNGFGPGTGPSFNTNLMLQANDRVDFAVGYGGNNFFYDSTGIQATLTSSPELSVQFVSAGQARFSWPTNFSGFTLESATNLAAATWITVTNAQITLEQQFTVTVDASLPQQFFRLHK